MSEVGCVLLLCLGLVLADVDTRDATHLFNAESGATRDLTKLFNAESGTVVQPVIGRFKRPICCV